MAGTRPRMQNQEEERRGSGAAQARHDRAHARSASVPLAYGVGEPRRQWIEESRA